MDCKGALDCGLPARRLLHLGICTRQCLMDQHMDHFRVADLAVASVPAIWLQKCACTFACTPDSQLLSICAFATSDLLPCRLPKKPQPVNAPSSHPCCSCTATPWSTCQSWRLLLACAASAWPTCASWQTRHTAGRQAKSLLCHFTVWAWCFLLGL